MNRPMLLAVLLATTILSLPSYGISGELPSKIGSYIIGDTTLVAQLNCYSYNDSDLSSGNLKVRAYKASDKVLFIYSSGVSASAFIPKDRVAFDKLGGVWTSKPWDKDEFPLLGLVLMPCLDIFQ